MNETVTNLLGIGGFLVYFLDDVPSDRAISFALAYAAGIMTGLSVVDLLLPMALRSVQAFIFSISFACFGALLCFFLSKINFPSPEDLMATLLRRKPGGTTALLPVISQEALKSKGMIIPPTAEQQTQNSWRVGVLLAVIITAHNLPEGVAVVVGTRKSLELGLSLTSAIFFHNVAEGVIIAIPLMRGLPNRPLAVGIAALTGLSEPIGAVLGVWVLQWVQPAAIELVVDASLALVAGIMISVSLRELLPLARRHSSMSVVSSGVLAGLVSMGVTLLVV